ncbi:MAG: hypothetical protein WCQ95_13165 [Bacteroidota bacterium]
MIRKTLLFVVACCVFFSAFAGQIELKGNYFGFNLHVLNPSSGSGFCVTQVLVNNILTSDEINSNAFEIDLSQLNLKPGDAVDIIIKHQDDCTPVVVNPKALQKVENFFYLSTRIDKTEKLNWITKGEPTDDPFIVEQFRWNKWVKVGEVSVGDTVKNSQYVFPINLHNGINQFRVVRNDANGNPMYSKVVKTASKKPEVTLESTKVTDKIVFSAETQYEIFDMKGNFVAEGLAKEVDIMDIEKGKYWLNYDNKTVNFVKK